jgi:hypothetical protein
MMIRNTQNRFSALISACVALLLVATAGWSQSLTWLGVLPSGTRSEAYTAFLPTGAW